MRISDWSSDVCSSDLFLDRGHPVTALDIDVSRLAALGGHAELEGIAADLEGGAKWPLGGRRFAGIVVTNYLHRPLLPMIVDAVAPGGALIYETRSEEHTSELQSLMRISYAVFCLKKKKKNNRTSQR